MIRRLILAHSWKKSQSAKGVLSDWVEVNPKTQLPHISQESAVSFIPMDAVGNKDGTFKVQEVPYAAVSKGYTRFASGDLIWAKITPCMQNGKSAVVEGLVYGVGFGSTEFHVLRPRTFAISSDYLWSLLSLDTLLAAAQSTFTGTAGQQRVPDAFLKNLPIPVPARDVQDRLVADLQAARATRDAKRAQADALLTGLDAYLLDRLGLAALTETNTITFAVRLNAVNATNRLNADYFHPERIRSLRTMQERFGAFSTMNLNSATDFIRDIVPSGSSDNYLGLANVQRDTGELVETNEEETTGQCFRFQQGDVLFGRLRPYLNKVYRAERDGICSTEFHVIRIRKAQSESDAILPDYLATMLRSSLVLAQTRHMMTGNTHPRLANEDVVNLVIPVPKEAIQQDIADEVTRRRGEARRLREEAAAEWEAARARFEAALLGEPTS